jgi:hypothetical protein
MLEFTENPIKIIKNRAGDTYLVVKSLRSTTDHNWIRHPYSGRYSDINMDDIVYSCICLKGRWKNSTTLIPIKKSDKFKVIM